MQTYYKNILRCWQILKPFHKWFCILLCIVFSYQIISVAITYFTGNIIKSLSENNTYLFILSCVFILLFNLSSVTIDYFDRWIGAHKTNKHLIQYLKMFSFEKVLSFNISQQIEQHSIIRKQTLDDGEDAVTKLISINFFSVLPTIFLILISLTIIATKSLLLFSASSFLLVALIYWSKKFSDFHDPYVRKNRNDWREQTKISTEAYQHLGIIKEFSQKEIFIKKYFGNRAKILKYDTESSMLKHSHVIKKDYIIKIFQTSFIAFSGLLFIKGAIDIGTVYIIFSLSNRIIDQIWDLNVAIRDIPIENSKLEQYFEIIDEKPAFNESGIKKFEVDDIVFDNLSFKYPKGENNVLNNFNLTIKKGQKVAFVGHSGNGKTTLSRLLMRAYDYNDGSIKIGKYELKDLDAGELRHKIGYVSQHIDLFDDTVRENILFGVKEKDVKRAEKRLDEIATLSRITEFYHRLGEKRLDQYVGEKGVKLSGGERQRIGIARAIIKDPEILIFDEATASLDAENEKYIKQAIDEVSQGKTTIIIAHRLSTIINCDVIHIIDKGQVLASGTHAELLTSSDFYNTLINSQEIAK